MVEGSGIAPNLREKGSQMKLKEFRIQNYRSVVDSEIINVADITVLIGANESGKSSILQGLASISMDSQYDYFELTQLNSILKKYNDGELRAEDIKIVWCEFELSEDDEKELQSILESDDPPSTFEVSKYFDESYEILIDDKKFHIPSQYLLKSTQEKINSVLAKLETKAQEHLTRDTNKPLAQQFNEAMTQTKKLPLSDAISKTEAKKYLQFLRRFIKAGADQTLSEDIERHLARIEQLIDRKFPNSKIEVSLFKYLLSRMPRTVYFKIYERLEDDVSLAELKARPQDHRTFHNFLKLAEIKVESLERLDEEKKRQVYIESGCGKATQLLREAWHQEALDIELRFSDKRFMVFTKNSRAVETLLPPSLGSEGFQWFLGFYINFGAATSAEYKRAILLLDDAGVFLHPKGHKDLLVLFEEYLKHDVTTIYSTHLPFLIPRKKLKRLRLVEKKSPEGRTYVTEKFYAVKDKDILYPLRAALGVTLADSLFVGEKTIVAEGMADRTLLNGVLEEFVRRNIKNMDLEHVEILAGKGVPGAKNHALMLQIENLCYVVVLDNDGEGRNAIEDFAKDGIPEENIILLPAINDSQKDFDIEDMFPLNIYAEAFKNVHGKFLNLTSEQIINALKEGKGKVNNKAKKLLKKSRTRYELDKVRIAYEILRIISSKDKLDKSVIKNFSKLFDELNRTIGIYES